MNETTPPSAPISSALPNASVQRLPEPPAHLTRLLLLLLLAVVAFDSCFWQIQSFGFSVAVFFAVLAGVIVASCESVRWTFTTVVLLTLLAGACVAAAFETGVTNTFVLLALTAALAGDVHFVGVGSCWGRWLSQYAALVRAPGRIFWLITRIMEAGVRDGVGWTGGLIGGCLLALPALFLALVFGTLLASGNAVFGSWTNSFFDWFWKELALYLDPWRVALWVLIAFIVLPLLRPVAVSAGWWTWMERLPRLPEIIPSRAALFSSGMILVVLNLLFLVANVADAMFLWSGKTMPSGINYKDYVHEGVDSLITTVLLTAVVLTAIFQQSLNVAQRRELKVLAFVWIAQNLFLLLSVALRIKFYIVNFELTVARLGVIIFLILVATGFVLLSIKIIRDKSLSWLVGGCVVAVFVTFYITQFLDLEGWSANYNVAVWQNDRTRQLDFFHLYQYGPNAWPAMRKVHDIDPSIAVLNANSSNGYPTTTDTVQQAQFDTQHWREFSLRAYLNRWALDDKK
jgi:hypothetical protein